MLGENFSSTKLIVAIIYILTELFTASCDNKVDYRSYGGKLVDITEVPYVLLIHVKIGKFQGQCTASLIAEEWVLTAAHCFPSIQLQNIKIIAGIDDTNNPKDMQIRFPLQIIIHPYYRKGGIAKWDFALAKIKSFDMTSEKVGIVPLGDEWPQHEMYNKTCMAVGWGIPDKFTKINTRLHSTQATGKHGSYACKCLKPYQQKRAVCLKQQEGTGICQGDSGGPLICGGKSYGVAHILYDTGSCKFMSNPKQITCGKYTTVDVYMFICPALDWIRSYVGVTPARPFSCRAVALFKEFNISVVIYIAIFEFYL